MKKLAPHPTLARNESMRQANAEEIARFWSKVRKTRGCWLWTASRDSGGYGILGIKRTIVRAHRFALFLATKRCGKSLALHSCSNRHCVKPAHLRWGTQLQNMSDKTKAGTQANMQGENNPRALLKTHDVVKIWQMLIEAKTDAQIAKEFNVNVFVVGEIRRKKKWRHLTKTFSQQNMPDNRQQAAAARDVWNYVKDKNCLQKEAAAHFKISTQQVSRIMLKQRWAQATSEKPNFHAVRSSSTNGKEL